MLIFYHNLLDKKNYDTHLCFASPSKKYWFYNELYILHHFCPLQLVPSESVNYKPIIEYNNSINAKVNSTLGSPTTSCSPQGCSLREAPVMTLGGQEPKSPHPPPPDRVDPNRKPRIARRPAAPRSAGEKLIRGYHRATALPQMA